MLFKPNFIKCITNAAKLCTRNLTTVPIKPTTNVPPALPSLLLTQNSWIWQKPDPIKLPIGNINPIGLPESLRITPIIDPNQFENVIEEPAPASDNSKQAARLIVIRRKKMKKHKLKKLRKKMKYEWAKLRQRRELQKEKEFQAGLIAQCKEADAFNAEEYVANKIKEATAVPPPPFYKTPEYKELMRIKTLRLYQYEKFKDYLK